MARVSQPADAHRARRQQLLTGISARLREMGIEAAFGVLEPYYDLEGAAPANLTGLAVREPVGTGRLQVTVVGMVRNQSHGEGCGCEDTDYDLDGELAYEVATLDGRGDGPGDPRAVWSTRQIARSEQGVVDAVRLWHGSRDSLRSTPPAPHPDRKRALLTRQIAARRSAAATPQVARAVDPSAAPPEQQPALAVHLEQLDEAQLCFHFPRDRNGRYVKSAVVTLAGYGTVPSKRGPWLAVRADGDRLVVGVEALIGENQDHRWDGSPWLWDSAHHDATAARRWQLPDAEHARPIVDLLDRHALADALTLCGVDVDDRLAALLDGYQINYDYARYTETWVARLYEQLPNCAPWRLAAACEVWQAERPPRRPWNDPIPLFGLKGLNVSAKPMVGVQMRDGVTRLVMTWTGSNARMPRALWERPADLEAALLATGAN